MSRVVPEVPCTIGAPVTAGQPHVVAPAAIGS